MQAAKDQYKNPNPSNESSDGNNYALSLRTQPRFDTQKTSKFAKQESKNTGEG